MEGSAWAVRCKRCLGVTRGVWSGCRHACRFPQNCRLTINFHGSLSLYETVAFLVRCVANSFAAFPHALKARQPPPTPGPQTISIFSSAPQPPTTHRYTRGVKASAGSCCSFNDPRTNNCSAYPLRPPPPVPPPSLALFLCSSTTTMASALVLTASRSTCTRSGAAVTAARGWTTSATSLPSAARTPVSWSIALARSCTLVRPIRGGEHRHVEAVHTYCTMDAYFIFPV